MAETSADSGGCDVVPAIEAHGGVDRVDAGVDGGEQGAELAAGGVVGVQVHGQVEPLAQRGDQRARGGGAEQPGHVLDRQHVRAGVDDPLGQPR